LNTQTIEIPDWHGSPLKFFPPRSRRVTDESSHLSSNPSAKQPHRPTVDVVDGCGWVEVDDSPIVECHGDYAVDDLLDDCRSGNAMFRVVELDEKPE
jgi:hypothetical protein